MISIIEYVKTLPYVDPARVGYMGMSHGGEMAFKITSEYDGLTAAIASEPANHEFLALTPDDTAHVNPESGLMDIESMLMRETDKVRRRIDMEYRARTDQHDQYADLCTGSQYRRAAGHLQGWLRLAAGGGQGVRVEKLRTRRPWLRLCSSETRLGVYAPDEVQLEAVNDSLAFFDRYMKP